LYLDKIYVKYLNKTDDNGKPIITEIDIIKPFESEGEVINAGDVYCREKLNCYMSKEQFYKNFLAEEVKFRASGEYGSVDFHFNDKSLEKIQEFYDKALME
jgi:hypothetical protein